MGRTKLLLVLLVLFGALGAAHGKPREPLGQRNVNGGYIGRPTWQDDVLLVPRLALKLPRLVTKAVQVPIMVALRVNERFKIVERVLDFLTSADGTFGVRPSFDFSSGITPLVGLSMFQNDAFGKNTSFTARALIGGAYLAIAEFNAHAIQTPHLQLDFGAGMQIRDDGIYFGIESLTPANVPRVESRFRFHSLDTPVSVRWKLKRTLAFVFGIEYAQRRYFDGATSPSRPTVGVAYCVRKSDGTCAAFHPDPTQVPLFDHGTDFIRTGVAVHYDTRDFPRKRIGVLVDGDLAYTHGLTDPSHYLVVSAAGGGVVNLFQGTHFLLMRLRLETLVPFNPTVPFTEFPSLGGPDTLRGYAFTRYRDFSSIIATAEYRWQVSRFAEAGLFVDYGGTLGKGFSRLNVDQLRPDIGTSVNFYRLGRSIIRVQLAYGIPDGGVHVYLSTGDLR